MTINDEKLKKIKLQLNHYWWFCLFIIVLFGAALRIVRHLLDPLISRDGILYLTLAENMAQGNSVAFESSSGWIPPLFPWLISLGIKCSFSPYSCGIAINIILGVLLIAMFYFLTQVIFEDRFWALLGAWFIGVMPLTVRLSGEIQRETLFLFFLTAAFYFWVKWLKGDRVANSWWCGVSCTIAFFARYEALEVIVFIGIAALWHLVRKKERWMELKNLAAFILGVLLTLGGGALLFELNLLYYVNALLKRIVPLI